MREVAIAGVGMTRFGPTHLNIKELFAQAALEALADSNLSPKQVQALFVGNVLGDFAEGQMNLAGFLADEIGLGPDVPATRVETPERLSTLSLAAERSNTPWLH